MKSRRVLVTGAAGFIGAHLCAKLLSNGWEVVGLDNLNAYYDVGIKHDRLRSLAETAGGLRNDAEPNGFSVARFTVIRGDICDMTLLESLFDEGSFDIVANLAAEAGVRYSIDNPKAYIESYLVGFANVLECCRHHPVRHFVFASSSSVYGGNKKVPYAESDPVDHPVSICSYKKVK